MVCEAKRELLLLPETVAADEVELETDADVERLFILGNETENK